MVLQPDRDASRVYRRKINQLRDESRGVGPRIAAVWRRGRELRGRVALRNRPRLRAPHTARQAPAVPSPHKETSLWIVESALSFLAIGRGARKVRPLHEPRRATTKLRRVDEIGQR